MLEIEMRLLSINDLLFSNKRTASLTFSAQRIVEVINKPNTFKAFGIFEISDETIANLTLF